MLKIFGILTIALLVLTAGCGFAIRFGGEQFKGAINGHIVLGILSIISVIITVIFIFKQ